MMYLIPDLVYLMRLREFPGLVKNREKVFLKSCFIVKLYYYKFTIIVKGLLVVYIYTIYSISEVLESLKRYTLGLSKYKI